MNARFPVAVRVRAGRDYRAAFADSRRVATRHFSLHLRTRDGGFCRLGMAVSRKVSPAAVVRNRIKRQIRERFRLRYRELPAGDCIVVARVGAAMLDKQALQRELDQLWDRLIALPVPSSNGTMPDPAPARAPAATTRATASSDFPLASPAPTRAPGD